MNHVLTASQFSQKELLDIFSVATEMEEVLQKGGSEMAKGKILAALFYEPSTRTRLSFETAMLRLGGGVISETDVTFSSQTKGEILADTIRIVSNCADIIALRSRTAGDASIAAEYASVPILNAGDGAGEHPTQSLLDLFTIQKHFQLGEAPLHLAFVGDLKYGRTVHSLATMIRNFENVTVSFVAPREVQMPEKYITKGDVVLTELTDEVLKNSDVVYATRIQKERFEETDLYERVKNAFIFDTEKVTLMHESAILLHPLPRVNEITLEVDALPQAQYFAQARNGIPVRMALIAKLLHLV
ncbi:aspartate carbamoyltransferase [Candidatus Gracilibacteria bacterium]|nr:aspartate carbamoyltransferase [Candidatus Gracilibacteria bacterium]